MPTTYADKVRKWAMEADADIDYPLIREQIEYLGTVLYDDYRPGKARGEKRFIDRLSDWLNNVRDERDQKIMFQLVSHLLYIGSAEFDSLYQAAFNGPVARWLIDETDTYVDRDGAQQRLQRAEASTWFCAITDSMQISEFYHLNHIEGVEVRPVWQTLYEFRSDTSIDRIVAYMKKRGFSRIVLLEDFIGSGTQMANAVTFVTGLPSKPAVLLCPIIICPQGADRARKLENMHRHLTFAPVLELPSNIFLSSQPLPSEDAFFGELRRTVTRLHDRLRNPKSKYGPHGFRRTGSLVVMHTNCPNNTIPIIHHASRSNDPWSPLFRRSERR